MKRLLIPAMIAATLMAAAPSGAASVNAATAVNVIKPVTLTKLQDLDFGTLSFAGFTGSRTIALSRAGAVTCAADIVCSGATKAARFNIQGTNNKVILITVTGGNMSNGVDSIAFTPNVQSSLTLSNSGAPGENFDVGGSISVSSALVGGVYTGTMNVTTDYQ